jgi:DNA-binding LacI/PurR family transcriptional regulator
MEKKKYQNIYEKIRKDIEERKYLVGDFLPTELEIAREFETSRPTVTKALEKLRNEKLIQSRSGYGTVVLRSELTHGKKIGLLIPQFGRAEIFEPICSAIQKESLKHYWQVFLPSDLLDHNDVKKTTELLCNKFVKENFDGVFFSPPNRIPDHVNFNLSILDQLKKAGIAVVLLDREILNWSNQTSCDLVGLDNIQAGLIVANHLLKQGCKKIVFAKHWNSTGMIDIRILGAREAIGQANLPPEALTVVKMDEKMEVKDITMHMPDGLICANDEMAADLMRRLLDAGIRIPQTLKVAGFDDVKYARFLSVPLTSYRQPCEEIGRTAVNTMLNRISDPDFAPARVYLQGELIVRFSTSRQ